MSVSAGTTRIVAMAMEGNNHSFDMEQRDPNNLNSHLQVGLLNFKQVKVLKNFWKHFMAQLLQHEHYYSDTCSDRIVERTMSLCFAC